MRTVKEVLDGLKSQERDQLMVAFEGDFSQYVELPDNKYIGVHANRVKHLEIEQSAGDWSIGRIRHGSA
jgi:hypothetical protein